MASPKLTLYTNHACPWAHRAHIALAELGLPFEEEIIDLSVPRTPEYLKVNPRGLVPSLKVGDEIITESAIVAGYLADAYPSHLLPASNEPNGPLVRARVAFFVDTYFSKANSFLYKVVGAKSDDEAASIAQELVANVVKEVEPLLTNAAPFFNGSEKLTLAEVLTGSFVIRLWSFPKYGLLPKGLLNDFETKAPNFYRWATAVSQHPSVTGIYNEKAIAEGTKKRFGSARFS
ncbi:thioredoxin-like protein [Biscogniauxia mediterranea]|nr:thioredoxin-like protein [Biscogniauxia mediterranea]